MAADKGLEEIPESMYLMFSRPISVDVHVCCSQIRLIVMLTHGFTAQIESNYDEVTDSFDSMNLKSELLRGRPNGATTKG